MAVILRLLPCPHYPGSAFKVIGELMSGRNRVLYLLHGPGHGALGCWCATFLLNQPDVFSAPQPGPSGGSFGQDGACPAEARHSSQGQSDRSEFSSAYWKP